MPRDNNIFNIKKKNYKIKGSVKFEYEICQHICLFTVHFPVFFKQLIFI